MKTLVPRIVFAIAIVSSAAGCMDSPTAPPSAGVQPSHEQAVQGCVVDGVCLLPPIGSGGGGSGWCDPRTSDCGDGGWDTCITTAPGTVDPGMVYTSGCPGAGGSGPGGDGGGSGDGGDGATTPPPDDPPPADTCRTGEQAIDAPDVSGQFQQLWLKSKLLGVEQGGWIVADASSFRLVPFQSAQYSPCGIDIYEAPPTGSVAILHTHPWPLWTSSPCGGLYTGTPSEEDRLALGLAGVPAGYFLDEAGIGKYTATDGEKAVRILRCGY